MKNPKYALCYKYEKVLLSVSIQGDHKYHTLLKNSAYPVWIVDHPEHAEMIRVRYDLPSGVSQNIPIHEFHRNELEVVEIIGEKVTSIDVALPTYDNFREYMLINHSDYAKTLPINGGLSNMSFAHVMEMVNKKNSIKLKMKTAFDPYQNESKIILKF